MVSGNGDKVLQGLAGLAAGHGFGCVELQVKQEVSQRRFIRINKSTSSFIGLCRSQYCRRSRARKFCDLYPVFANLAGLTQRNGNTFNSGWSLGTRQQAGTQGRTRFMRRYWQNASLTHSSDSGQKMTSLFATHYSLFASLEFIQ